MIEDLSHTPHDSQHDCYDWLQFYPADDPWWDTKLGMIVGCDYDRWRCRVCHREFNKES